MENRKLYPPGTNVFGFPQGLLGVLAGWLMGRLSVEHNTWAVHHLDVQPTDHVLEIGFGPGLGIQLIADRAIQGVTVGIDPSPVMMRQATKRNASSITSGRVELREGAMPSLPFSNESFDKVLSVNNVMLWPTPELSLAEVHRILKPAGRLVISLNPRWAKTYQDVVDMGHEIVDMVAQAGFVDITTELRHDLKPAGAVIVIAYK
jgi:ubiquinone/menaquinone biosynthesis C-methylase UbiE